MIKRYIILLTGLLFFYYLPTIATASEIPPLDQETDRYIVFFNQSIDEEIITKYGGSIIYKYEMIQAASIEINAKEVENLQQSPLIKKVSKDNNVEINVQHVPWGHKNIGLLEKQPTTLSGKGIKIAILDTGIEKDHPDLNVKGGTCVLDLVFSKQACQNSFIDENGHGTHVAGIIAARDNSVGIVGVAPEAEIYAIKALDSDGNGTTTTVMAGLQWAIENKMDIINMSFTTPSEDIGMKALIDKAYEKGIIIIAAAGNFGATIGNTESVQYPAKHSNVIAVGGTNANNLRVPTSSTGKEVELAAPGMDILSTYPTSLNSSGYAYMTGTSMAAPFVTGVAALYKQKYPSYTNVQIRSLLQQNAKDLGAPGRDSHYGYGLVQMEQEQIANNDETPIEVVTSSGGLVTLDMSTILSEYEGYNLYRFDQLIIEKGTASSVSDFGKKGNISYSIYPLVNGVEQKEKAVKFQVGLSTPEFYDLNNAKWYSRYLIYLNSEGILKGYEGNLIMPENYVTRAEAVAMLGRALGYDETKRKTRFKDVPSQTFASGYIESAAERGVLKGFSDGTFKPDEPVTRAEMAILLSKAYELTEAKSVTFDDVNKSMAGYQEIHNLAASKITQGYADGTFKPYEKMYRSTYSVFLAKAKNENFR